MWVVVAVLITAIYPLAVWLGEGRVEPRLLAGLLAVLLLLRLRRLWSSKTGRYGLAAGLLVVAIVAWSNAALPLKLYPVLVNAAMLGFFGYSLVYPPSAVERFARLREPDLPARAVDYTRRVTRVWCVFFAVNGAIALATALWASPGVWSLYNGLIAYLLMGSLFAVEYCVRRRVQRASHA